MMKGNILNKLFSLLVVSLIVGQVTSRHKKKDFTDEETLQRWLDNFNKGVEPKVHRWTVSIFNWHTNITVENTNKLLAAQGQYQVWIKKKIKIANDIVKSLPVTNSPSYRMLRIITSASILSNNNTINRRIGKLGAELTNIYGLGQVDNRSINDLEADIKTGSYMKKLRVWRKWRDEVGPKMRKIYPEYVQLLNQVARENGFENYADAWREQDYGFETSTKYMEDNAEKIYQQILPLYKQLHAYVRRKLHQKYPGKIDLTGQLPAHILGDMWALQWRSVEADVLPFPNAEKIDITPELKKQNFTPRKMFDLAEKFFVSIGLPKMPDAFWERSMLSKPEDRAAQCTAAAFDFFKKDQVGISMCTRVTQQHLNVVHHEMGHIQYFLAYGGQPTILRQGTNAAFHEAIGDSISLSVETPEYYRKIGLLPDTEIKQSDKLTETDMNFLMKQGLFKIAFLPYAYVMGKYRWDVFKEVIDDTNLNAKWWEMRESIQGIKSPVSRNEEKFDPGAKFHVAGNFPYIRYYYAAVAQFQFYKAMCAKSGHSGFLHRCNFYESKQAGKLLSSMMELGQSVPWPVAMKKMTKQKEFDVTPMLDYFKPLYNWLEKENKKNNEFIGWK